MNLYRKSTKSFLDISCVLSAVFLLQLIATPISYTQGITIAPKQNNPFRQLGQVFIMSDFTGNEILTDVESNHVISRNLRDFQRLLNRILNTSALPLVSFAVLLCYYIPSFRKPEQKIPVLAISMGGHAPPQKF
jgi:hypothetical protein